MKIQRRNQFFVRGANQPIGQWGPLASLNKPGEPAARGSRRSMRRNISTAVALAAALAVGASIRAAAPIVPTAIEHGAATFATHGPLTTITAANQTIIDYSRFNIPNGDTVRFVQPGASATVLNRINSAVPSQIDGNLFGNGVVYLVNPAGVMFGADAVVNVGQLYAAASHITNQNFLSGVNQFTGGNGLVDNQGVIRASAVNLIGQQVGNEGTILAPKGMVALEAGKDVYVGRQDGSVYVQIKDTPTPAAAQKSGIGVSNTGTINADGGSVSLTAGDIYSIAARHSGTITAGNITVKGGKDTTVLVSGKLDASNQGPVGQSGTGVLPVSGTTGGAIAINAGQIGIGVNQKADGDFTYSGATIDASGANGGGKILIGVKPDAHSATGYVDAANYDFISANSTLNASATNSGNGGLIDTSGANLQINPGATITAAGASGGTAGEWLMDPYNVVITHGSASYSGLSMASGSYGSATFGANASGASITDGEINSVLSSGTTVTVNTGAGGTGNGDITLASGAAITSPGNLTLSAAGGIDIEGTIATQGGPLNVSFDASGGLANLSGSGVLINGPISTDGGDLTVDVIGSRSGQGYPATVNATINTSGRGGGRVAIFGLAELDAGSITSSGGQYYYDPVFVSNSCRFADDHGGDIAFLLGLSSYPGRSGSVAIATGGVVYFGGAVGSVTPLGSLTVTGATAIDVVGSSVGSASTSFDVIPTYGYTGSVPGNGTGSGGGSGGYTPPSSQQFTLLGASEWDSSGIAVQSGQTITISASGQVYIGAQSDASLDYEAPAGDPGLSTANLGGGKFAAPGLVPWSLVGRIGQNGTPFEIGAGTTITAAAAGHLYLSVNDNNFGDNSGNWTVNVEPAAAGSGGGFIAASSPNITNVDFVGGNGGYFTATVLGSGFGSSPANQAGKLAGVITVGDIQQELAYEAAGLIPPSGQARLVSWSNNSVVISGVSGRAGDAALAEFYSVSKGVVAIWGGNFTPPPVDNPQISAASVSLSGGNYAINIAGANFGAAPNPFGGQKMSYLSAIDLGQENPTSTGNLLLSPRSTVAVGSAVGAVPGGWQADQIHITGSNSAAGGTANFISGDPVAVLVFNSGDTGYSGPATAWGGFVGGSGSGGSAGGAVPAGDSGGPSGSPTFQPSDFAPSIAATALPLDNLGGDASGPYPYDETMGSSQSAYPGGVGQNYTVSPSGTSSGTYSLGGGDQVYLQLLNHEGEAALIHAGGELAGTIAPGVGLVVAGAGIVGGAESNLPGGLASNLQNQAFKQDNNGNYAAGFADSIEAATVSIVQPVVGWFAALGTTLGL